MGEDKQTLLFIHWFSHFKWTNHRAPPVSIRDFLFGTHSLFPSQADSGKMKINDVKKEEGPAEFPGCSYVAVKSDCSKEEPPYFSAEPK